MKAIFLGTGSSSGVPKLGCECNVCNSPRITERRTRASLAITAEVNTTILIDTSPDLRTQLIRSKISEITAIFFTHHHADHLLGIYDVARQRRMPIKKKQIYCARKTSVKIKELLELVHEDVNDFTIKLIDIYQDGVFSTESIQIDGATVCPLPVWHGSEEILAYLVVNNRTNRRMAYITDCSKIPPATIEKLRGIETLILGVLKQESDPFHFGLCDLPGIIDQINPGRVFLTHLSHDICHKAVISLKLDNVQLAHDGLEVII